MTDQELPAIESKMERLNMSAESSLKEQLKVAKDNVEFLKNEHAYMLKSLHEEIEKLHHKCRDLQFRCEAEGCILPNNDFFRCSPQVLEQKVESLLQENADLKRRLHESHQAIDILDQKEKAALWHHHQEMERRDTAITRLQRELEAKCSALSQLGATRSRKKGANFWRRFSFSSQPSPAASPPPQQQQQQQHLSREDLPSQIQDSLNESQYQSCSSYSSLSDKSVSDDEERRVKLPPITCPRQMVRQQLRIRSKQDALLPIDRIPSPEVKRPSNLATT